MLCSQRNDIGSGAKENLGLAIFSTVLTGRARVNIYDIITIGCLIGMLALETVKLIEKRKDKQRGDEGA